MKKNYALFLTGMLVIGLIFSIGFAGCDNVTGETGPRGNDVANPLTIGVSDIANGVVALGDKVWVYVTFNDQPVPDPASVSWKVWGDRDWNNTYTKVSTNLPDSNTYYNRNQSITQLTVGREELSSIVYLEASYMGWTCVKELVVGVPYQKVKLEPGNVINIGTSHISLYDWTGTGDAVGNGSEGLDAAEATTYLVWGHTSERVTGIRNGDMVPADIVGTYHLNDDIKVTPDDWITFYEVSASNPNYIISYGSDQAYIYARFDNGVYDPGAKPNIFTNIQLPTTEGLPNIRGLFPTGANYHTTFSPSPGPAGAADPAITPAGSSLLTTNNNGDTWAHVVDPRTKDLKDYTVTLVHEGEIFKEYTPDLWFGGESKGGGYNMKNLPSGGVTGVADFSASKDIKLPLITGYYRYVVKYNDPAIWTVADVALNVSGENLPGNTSGNRNGIYVNQNNVKLDLSGRGTANYITLKAGGGNGRFVKGIIVSNPPFTTSGGGTTGLNLWFVDDEGYRISTPTFEKDPESVNLLLNLPSAPIWIIVDKSAFVLGGPTLKDTSVGNTQVLGTAAFKVKQYAVINGAKSGTQRSGPRGGGNSSWDLSNGWAFNDQLIYTVQAPGWGPALPGTNTDQKITISWYKVDGPNWGTTAKPIAYNVDTWSGVYPSGVYGPSFPPSTFSFELQRTKVSPGVYTSIVDPHPDTRSNINAGTYGDSYGIIVGFTTGNPTLFVNGTTGEKVLDQFVVGVVRD
jgi:hypothetical protein